MDHPSNSDKNEDRIGAGNGLTDTEQSQVTPDSPAAEEAVTLTHDEAGQIAGETVAQVGATTGEFPAEQVAKPPEPSTGKSAFLVGSGILISRIVGLVRQRVMSHYFGTSAAGDVFVAAFRIPNFLQNVFGEGALSASFIPVYARLLAEGNEKEATRVANAVFGLLALVTSIVVLLGVLGSSILIDLIAPGFETERRELTIHLVKIFFPAAGLLVFSAWCLGVLNSHHRFFISYTAPVAWNLTIIGTLLWYGSTSSQFELAEIAAWGALVGSALQFGVQIPTVVKLMPRLLPVIDVANKHVRTVVKNFFPVFISRGVIQISAFVDEIIASYLPFGAMIALSYGQSLYTLPVSLFGMSISAAELPAMSRTLGAVDRVAEQLRQRLNTGLRRIAFLIVPSAVAFMTLGDVMAAALYQTGRFDRNAAVYVWGILAGSGLGLLASTLGRLYSSTYYALRDTRTPLIFAIVHVVLATVLGYLFALPLPRMFGIDPKWGVIGLTSAASIAAWIEFVLLRRSLNQRIGQTGVPIPFFFKLLLGALVGAGAGWGFKLILPALHPILVAAVVLGSYGTVYFGITWALGVSEAGVLIRRSLGILRLTK